MNKTRIVNNKKNLFIGHLFAFFIMFTLILGELFIGNHVYAGMNYSACSVEIPVSVSKDYGESYDNEIVIEPLSESDPMPETGSAKDGKMVIQIKDNNSEKIKIDFEEPGEYEYKIYENKGSEGTVEYDSRIYHATVFVIDNDGKLDYVLSLKIEGENAKPEKLQFVNIEEEKTEKNTETSNKDATREKEEDTIKASTEESTEEMTEETVEESTNKGNGEDETNIDGNAPTTGDTFPLETVLLIMFVSCALVFALVYIKIRLSKVDDEDIREKDGNKEEDSSDEN